MERIIKSSRFPGDVVYVNSSGHPGDAGHDSYVCIDAETEDGEERAHLHLTVEESRKLRKALKAAERGN